MARPPGAKNRSKPESTPRSEALHLVRRMLARYEEDNSELSYQQILSSLAFVRELGAIVVQTSTE